MRDFDDWNPDYIETARNPKYDELEITNEDYEKIDGLNWSKLSVFLQEPAYFSRHRDVKKESSGFEMGTFLHRMILEPEKYGNLYKQFEPPLNPTTNEPYKSGKKYQEALDDFIASGNLVAPDNGASILEEIRANLEEYDLMKYLTGKTEVGLTAKLEGTLLKGRLDCYSEKFGIVDFKTTSSKIYSLENDYFRYKIREYGYVYQLAFYATIVNLQTGSFPECYIVAAQTTTPFQTGLYHINERLIRQASDKIIDEYIPLWKVNLACGRVGGKFFREIENL